MKKAIKLVWMMLFALPMVAFTSCGDDDELVNGDDQVVKLKDYSDLIGKSYDDVLKKMGNKYDIDATDQFQIVYTDFNFADLNDQVQELDVLFTFYVEDENGNVVPNSATPYKKAVEVDVTIEGYENAYLVNRLEKLYDKGTYHEEDGDIWYTYEKDGKYIVYEYVDGENGQNGLGEITYVDKKEFDKAFPASKAVDQDIRALRDRARKAVRK